MSNAIPNLSLPAPSESESTLVPRRALLHPAWLGGVVVLAVNDHLLKGADLLPGLVTGKLSDFAGLFIAPVLFASLIGVRSRRGLLEAHAMVGVVFAALQLSPTFAAAWSQLFHAFGVAWTTTMDPTDLVALVALVASYRVLTPAAQPKPRLARAWRRGATIGAAAGGLAASVATSPPPTDFEEFFPDISAQTFVHNQSDIELSVLLRPIREDLALDCAEISLDPGGLLPDAAFAPAERWQLPARTSISAWTGWEERECYAVQVSGDRFAPFIMFWDGDLPNRIIPGQTPEGSALDGWGVTIVSSNDGQVLEIADTSSELSYVPTAPQTQPGEGCELAEPGSRVDWVDISTGTYAISSVDFGVDGCFRVTYEGPAGPEGDGYICMPAEAFPFRSGDLVDVVGFTDTLTIQDAGLPADEVRWLRLHRGVNSLNLNVTDFDLAARSVGGCGFEVDLDCVQASQRAEVLVVGDQGSATLAPGDEPAVIPVADGRVASFYLPYGATRALLDAECAAGSNLLGADIDLVTLIQPEL